MKSKIVLPLALLALVAFYPRLQAGEFEARLKMAEKELAAHRLTEAERIAAELVRENLKAPPVLDLKAMIAFYQGRYEESLRLIEEALAGDPTSAERQMLRLFIQRTRDTAKSLQRFESEHFILYLQEEKDGILVPYALDALEKSRRAIGEALGYFPREKVRVEIAPDVTAFNAISTLSLRDIEETGAVGIARFNKIMTISPRVLLQGYRWLDALSHEYLHHALVGLTRNNAPIWLHEGIARFFETRWRKPGSVENDYLTPANQTLLAQALSKDRFVGFKKMEPSLIHLETPEEVQLAYAEAASAVDFLVQRKGEAGLREFLSEITRRPTHEALEAVLGMSFEAFQAEWKDFLKGKSLTEIEGTRVRKLKVKGDRREDEEAVELKEIQSLVARNRTHLGDRLLERGRIEAATEEYRRALQASPYSPIILNKLARVLARKGRYGEGLAYLDKARRLEPDHVGTYIQLGRLYHATQNHSQARLALEEAIQINPFNPSVHQLLHEVYAVLGMEDAAKKSRAILQRLTRR